MVNGRQVKLLRDQIFVYSCTPSASLKANIMFSIFLKLGPALPKALGISSMVEVGDNLYVIGGYSTDGSNHQNEIHQLSCISGLCSWITLTQQLKIARYSLIAIPVDNSFCSPVGSQKTLISYYG